jgi:polyisoprenoid-binding protein YceI
MHVRSAVLLLCIAVLAGFAPPVRASRPLLISLDPESTSISFTLDAVAHTVHGTARLKGGAMRYEPSSGEISGEVVVDARSLVTGRKGRDEDMHEKVLESSLYPDIIFRPERADGSFDPSDRSGLVVSGTIEIHGEGHEISLPLTVSLSGQRFEATGSLQVPYVEWGMNDPSFFVFRVAKVVHVQIEASGTVSEVPGD